MATRLTDPRRAGLTFEPNRRWIRSTRAGTTIVDSKQALLWEARHPIVKYAFARDDVAGEALSPSRTTQNGHHLDKAYYDLTLRRASIERAAWSWLDHELSEYAAFTWTALDHRYEEDEEVFDHMRDLPPSSPRPLPGLEYLDDTVGFYCEHAGITVDGELQPRPQTPWSTRR